MPISRKLAESQSADEQQKLDDAARERLDKSTLSPEQRFGRNMLGRMLHFLQGGYKIKEYNGLDNTTKMNRTILEYNGKEQPFLHEYPLEPILTPSNGEEVLIKY